MVWLVRQRLKSTRDLGARSVSVLLNLLLSERNTAKGGALMGLETVLRRDVSRVPDEFLRTIAQLDVIVKKPKVINVREPAIYSRWEWALRAVRGGGTSRPETLKSVEGFGFADEQPIRDVAKC